MKAILEFELPDDQFEHLVAVKAMDMYALMSDTLEHIEDFEHTDAQGNTHPFYAIVPELMMKRKIEGLRPKINPNRSAL